MSEWQSYRIADLGQVVTGRTPASSKPELLGSGTAFVTPTDISEQSIYAEPQRRLSSMGDAEFLRVILPPDAVCFTCIASIGKMCLTKEPTLTNQQINSLIVDHSRVVSRWAFYALKAMREEITAIASGSATPIINKTSFGNIRLSVPPLATQRRIASVLGAYDDLIEVNRRRIAVLEEMARGLFEEWFVRFRFPGHELITMAESRPNDWRLVKVGEVLRKFRRPVKVKKQNYETDGIIPCVDQGADFIGGYTNNTDALIASPLPLCVFGDHTRVLKFIGFPFASGADGTQLLYPVDGLTPEFLYFSLLNVDLSNQHYARHFKFLKEQEIWLPTFELVERFTAVVKPQMELVENIRFQNQKLATSRDLLLPRLISGQLSVAETEYELGEAA